MSYVLIDWLSYLFYGVKGKTWPEMYGINNSSEWWSKEAEHFGLIL